MKSSFAGPFLAALGCDRHFDGTAGTLSFTDTMVTLSVEGVQVIPEPSTFLLAALGLLGWGVITRRRRKRSA